jgi:hypothetical protein
MIHDETVMKELENFVFRKVVICHGEMVAMKCAEALFECLWLNFRKQCLYVPSTYNQASLLQDRNKAIWEDFNGTNYAELSIKYRLSLQQIYNITRMMRKNPSGCGNRIGRPSDESRNKPLVLVVIEEYLPPSLTKCGLVEGESKNLAAEVAGFLCRSFPGVLIRFNDSLKNSRQSATLLAAT